MFDFARTEPRNKALDFARSIFVDHGGDLAEAAALLGGAAGEARVASCALQLATAARVTPRIRRDLEVIYRLLTLENVGDPHCLETELFSMLDPASPEVETICMLTEMLDTLLSEVEELGSASAEDCSFAA
ncbi:hypothetical protein ACR03S_13235 [Limimaricola variabilis]